MYVITVGGRLKDYVLNPHESLRNFTSYVFDNLDFPVSLTREFVRGKPFVSLSMIMRKTLQSVIICNIKSTRHDTSIAALVAFHIIFQDFFLLKGINRS